jgi:magnesium-transporting ATPase (P-type)
MNSLPNLVAIVASFVLIFFLNYVFYGVVAAEFFENHAGSATGVQKEEVDMMFIALGTFVQALALTLLYAKWSNGVHNAVTGFRFGALAGLFAGFGMTFIMYGTSNLYDFTGLIADGAWYVLLYGICGMVIAMVMAKVGARSG